MAATDTLSDKAIKSAIRPAVGHAAGMTPGEQLRAKKQARARKAEADRLAASGMPGADMFEHTTCEWHAYMAPSWSQHMPRARSRRP